MGVVVVATLLHRSPALLLRWYFVLHLSSASEFSSNRELIYLFLSTTYRRSISIIIRIVLIVVLLLINIINCLS